MNFNPVTAGQFAKALKDGDDVTALLSVLDLTQSEALVNSAKIPDLVYNDLELAELIEAKLVALSTASVAMAFGTLVPEIMGLALTYLEKMAYHEEEDDGKTDSQPEQQSTEEDVAGA